jgi:hypothetical protein
MWFNRGSSFQNPLARRTDGFVSSSNTLRLLFGGLKAASASNWFFRRSRRYIYLGSARSTGFSRKLVRNLVNCGDLCTGREHASLKIPEVVYYYSPKQTICSVFRVALRKNRFRLRTHLPDSGTDGPLLILSPNCHGNLWHLHSRRSRAREMISDG